LALRVAERGGVVVWQEVDVRPERRKLTSQLMPSVGARNSPPFGVCIATSVVAAVEVVPLAGDDPPVVAVCPVVLVLPPDAAGEPEVQAPRRTAATAAAATGRNALDRPYIRQQ
jgi:hypothetical protein